VRLPVSPIRPGAVHGHLELSGVEFRYPGAEKPVLCDISLIGRPGETTAVIGSTGTGKTTLLNLIPRLMDATAGTVKVDGVDVRDLDQPLLPRAVGLVPQKRYRFPATVASTLRSGNPDATAVARWPGRAGGGVSTTESPRAAVTDAGERPAAQRHRNTGAVAGPAARLMGGGAPPEKALDFKGSLKRLLQLLRPQRAALIGVLVLGAASV